MEELWTHMNSMNPWSTPPGHASEGRGKLHCPTLPQDKMVFDQDFLATGVGCLWKAWFQHHECTNLHGSVPKMSASSPLQGKVCTVLFSMCRLKQYQVSTTSAPGLAKERPPAERSSTVMLFAWAGRPLGLSYENLGWDLKLYFFRKK